MGIVSESTIAAIATPPGTGGIGIIRISGPLAFSIFLKLFRPNRPHSYYQSHKFYYGTVADSAGVILDEVLAVYMKAPNTYTREDVVEFHSHGSYLVLQSILRAVFSSGARPAEPGEFTKRAFLAGRIDLTQAEAVIDLLQAQTESSAQLAVNQLQGKLFARIEAIRENLVNILAILEVAIDFPDEDVEILDTENLNNQLLQNVQAPLIELIKQADHGKIFREGINIVIGGRPNVGKSSLLNALLQEDRALVTSVPGTTRDTIEEFISIGGVPVHLVDTAGIRNDAGEIEELGIKRARKKIQEADLVLFVVDPTEPLTSLDHQIYEFVRKTDHIIVINKNDIVKNKELEAMAAGFSSGQVISISAREHYGLKTLQQAIYKKIIGGDSLAERGSCAPNVRHRIILEKTLQSVIKISEVLVAGISPDLITIEIQSALDQLGDIVGLTTPDDVLEKIFSDFCIGK